MNIVGGKFGIARQVDPARRNRFGDWIETLLFFVHRQVRDRVEKGARFNASMEEIIAQRIAVGGVVREDRAHPK